MNWQPKATCPFCLKPINPADWSAHKASHLIDCRKLLEQRSPLDRLLDDLRAVN